MIGASLLMTLLLQAATLAPEQQLLIGANPENPETNLCRICAEIFLLIVGLCVRSYPG